MSNDDRGCIPKWGELPVEQYLIARSLTGQSYCAQKGH